MTVLRCINSTYSDKKVKNHFIRKVIFIRLKNQSDKKVRFRIVIQLSEIGEVDGSDAKNIK